MRIEAKALDYLLVVHHRLRPTHYKDGDLDNTCTEEKSKIARVNMKHEI